MPQILRLESQVQSSSAASSTGENGDHDKRDADANMKELSTNKTAIDGVYIVDAEKGSSPHVIKDGGLVGWSTVLGA